MCYRADNQLEINHQGVEVRCLWKLQMDSGHNRGSGGAVYGSTTKHTAQFTSFIEQEYGFGLDLKTVSPLLSGNNGPPRVVCDDNKEGSVRVCVSDMCVCSCGRAILYWGIEKRRCTEESGLCSVELWSKAKHTGPSLRKANSLSHNNPVGAWGSCRWTHRVTLSIARHCSG